MSNEKTETTKPAPVPSYVAFCADLRARYAELGIPLVESAGTDTGLPENAGWVRFESAVNGHKVYVPKSKGEMALLETTLPIQHLNGTRPLAKYNGKILARHLPDVDLVVANTADLMASPDDRLPANRKPTKREASQAG